MRRLVVSSVAGGVAIASVAILFVLYATGTFEPSLASQLRKVERGALPGWYAGAQLGGLELTAVEPASGSRVSTFGYGHCHRVGTTWNPFSATTCGFPLLIQTWQVGGALGAAFVPTLPNGTCHRLVLRGVPAAAAPGAVALYTGGEAVAVLGPPDLLESAVAALRPAGRPRPATLPAPTTGARAALADCDSRWNPFEPLRTRIRRLATETGLPLVTAGAWFRDAQLVSATETAGAVSLDYRSCRAHSDFDACDEPLSIVAQPASPSLLADVAGDLRGARCERFSVAGAPAVVWHKATGSGDEAGIYLFSARAVVEAAHDFSLEGVSMGRVRDAARQLRPLGRRTLPPPARGESRLLRLCAETKPLETRP